MSSKNEVQDSNLQAIDNRYAFVADTNASEATPVDRHWLNEENNNDRLAALGNLQCENEQMRASYSK